MLLANLQYYPYLIAFLALAWTNVLIKVLLDDEPVSSRKVLVNVEKRDDADDKSSDPDNMTFVLAKMGSNITLNCSDLGEEEDLVLWTKQDGERQKF